MVFRPAVILKRDESEKGTLAVVCNARLDTLFAIRALWYGLSRVLRRLWPDRQIRNYLCRTEEMEGGLGIDVYCSWGWSGDSARPADWG